MKNQLKTLLFILISLGVLSCSNTDINEFVSVNNGQFVLKGKPYYYLGTNFWHGAYMGAGLVKGDKERLLKELDQLAEHGITNLRIMAASEESALEMSVTPAFQIEPGVYNEDLFVGLDYLLNEMGKRDMKAVMVLNNYWQWSGGMSQYMNWVTGIPVIDPDKTGDWDGFQAQSATFYSSVEANKIYRDYIKMLINRKNTLTGNVYKEDPVIMSWQLSNEPRPAPTARNNEESRQIFYKWVDETAKYIKDLDNNHLVSTGNEGAAGCRWNIDIYSNSHQSEYVDYLTFHIWPKNWGWYDATKPDSTFDKTLEKTLDYFQEHIKVAREHNMPIVLEEFGLERDSGSLSPQSSTNLRNRYLDMIFSTVVESAKEGSPMAGLNFWAWGGLAKASSEDCIWRKGDSFMGDPPQEPQGLNSVFSSDIQTLKIFKKYNEELKELNDSE